MEGKGGGPTIPCPVFRIVNTIAELIVGPSGPLGLSTQSGPCVLESRTEAHESYRYDCQGAAYWFFFRRRRRLGSRSPWRSRGWGRPPAQSTGRTPRGDRSASGKSER